MQFFKFFLVLGGIYKTLPNNLNQMIGTKVAEISLSAQYPTCIILLGSRPTTMSSALLYNWQCHFKWCAHIIEPKNGLDFVRFQHTMEEVVLGKRGGVCHQVFLGGPSQDPEWGQVEEESVFTGAQPYIFALRAAGSVEMGC
jgi:hypothetical protein